MPAQARTASPEFLSSKEAADYLHVNMRWIRRARDERRIPFFKVGRLTMFDRRDLDAFLANGYVQAAS